MAFPWRSTGLMVNLRSDWGSSAIVAAQRLAALTVHNQGTLLLYKPQRLFQCDRSVLMPFHRLDRLWYVEFPVLPCLARDASLARRYDLEPTLGSTRFRADRSCRRPRRVSPNIVGRIYADFA
jgi:hypothetical protein